MPRLGSLLWGRPAWLRAVVAADLGSLDCWLVLAVEEHIVDLEVVRSLQVMTGPRQVELLGSLLALASTRLWLLPAVARPFLVPRLSVALRHPPLQRLWDSWCIWELAASRKL